MLELGVSSSFSAEKSSKDPAKSSSGAIRVHHLREFHQPDCGRELGIFHRRCHAPCGLCMRQIGRYLENVRGEMIDSAQETAAASDENTGTEITKIRFLFESAFEQLKCFAQPQVNDGV